MKQYLLLFLPLLAIICVASCTKSDKIAPQKALADTTIKKVVTVTPPSTPAPPQKTLMGRWDMFSEQFVKYLDGTQVASGSGVSAGNNYSYVIFNSDSTYTCLAEDWYPIVPVYGTAIDNSSGSFKLSADSILTISSYLTGLNTVYNGVSPNAPPIIVPISDRVVIRQFTDTTLTIHHEYVYKCTDASAGAIGTYENVFDLVYTRQAPKN